MPKAYKAPTADQAIGNIIYEERQRKRQLERDIVADILRDLRSLPDTFCWKEHGGMYGQAGIPDIICCIAGRVVAFEVKSATGKPSMLQEVTIRQIRDAGGAAYVVRSVKEVEHILEQMEFWQEVGTHDDR